MEVLTRVLCVLICFQVLLSERLVKCNESGSGQGGSTQASGTTGTGKTSSSDKKSGIELDISKKEATSDYQRQEGSYDVLFYGKENKKFQSVKNGNTLIWSTDKSSEYAIKVKVTDDGVSIHFEKGDVKRFVKTRTGCCPSLRWVWIICTCGIYHCCTKDQWVEDDSIAIKGDKNSTTKTSGGGANQTGTTPASGTTGTGQTGTTGTGGTQPTSGGGTTGTGLDGNDQDGTSGGGTPGE